MTDAQQMALRMAREAKAMREELEQNTADSAPQIDLTGSDFNEMFDELVKGSVFDATISIRRKLAAFLVSGSLAFGAGYGIGTLAAWAMAAMATAGMSAIWGYVVMILAILIAIYAGLKIGQYVGNYILSGQIDRDLAKVTGWFKRKPVEVAAPEPAAA